MRTQTSRDRSLRTARTRQLKRSPRCRLPALSTLLFSTRSHPCRPRCRCAKKALSSHTWNTTMRLTPNRLQNSHLLGAIVYPEIRRKSHRHHPQSRPQQPITESFRLSPSRRRDSPHHHRLLRARQSRYEVSRHGLASLQGDRSRACVFLRCCSRLHAQTMAIRRVRLRRPTHRRLLRQGGFSLLSLGRYLPVYVLV